MGSRAGSWCVFIGRYQWLVSLVVVHSGVIVHHRGKFAVTLHGQSWRIVELSIGGNRGHYRHSVNGALLRY